MRRETIEREQAGRKLEGIEEKVENFKNSDKREEKSPNLAVGWGGITNLLEGNGMTSGCRGKKEPG